MRVSIVIPTYNEAGSIARVLDDIPAFLVNEVLLVDAGSTDGTREIASGRGARVSVEPRRGYGRACLTGIATNSFASCTQPKTPAGLSHPVRRI